MSSQEQNPYKSPEASSVVLKPNARSFKWNRRYVSRAITWSGTLLGVLLPAVVTWWYYEDIYAGTMPVGVKKFLGLSQLAAWVFIYADEGASSDADYYIAGVPFNMFLCGLIGCAIARVIGKLVMITWDRYDELSESCEA